MARVVKGCSSANSGHWSSPLFLSYTALLSSEGEIDESCSGSDAGWTCSSSAPASIVLSMAHHRQAQVRPSPTPPPAPPRRPPNQHLVERPLRSLYPRRLPSYRSPCVCVSSKDTDAATHRAPACARMCASGP